MAEWAKASNHEECIACAVQAHPALAAQLQPPKDKVYKDAAAAMQALQHKERDIDRRVQELKDAQAAAGAIDAAGESRA